MLKQAVAAVGLLLVAQQACAGETSNLQQCKAQFADPEFDCACVLNFLKRKFDDGDVTLLMAIWAYSVDGRRDHSGDLQRLDTQYGRQKINQLLWQFHQQRSELLMQCPQAGPEGKDDY